MPRKRRRAWKKIIAKLRQVDVLVWRGPSVVDAIRQMRRERSHVLSVAPSSESKKKDI